MNEIDRSDITELYFSAGDLLSREIYGCKEITVCNKTGNHRNADLVRVITSGYHTGVYQIRNEWMVSHSARVIAVFNGQPSGTKNTIDYAKNQGIPVRIIEG